MVMDAPVKFFSGANAHAWDKNKLKAKLNRGEIHTKDIHAHRVYQ